MVTLSKEDVDAIAAAVAAKLSSEGSSDNAANIAAAAAHKVVQEMTVKGLAFVGIDVADKNQIQQIKDDLGFLRSFRLGAERMGRNIGSAITNALVWGVLFLIVVGFLFWSKNGGAPHPMPPQALSK